jgi:thiol-disulfide isomerase/thioredoxin
MLQRRHLLLALAVGASLSALRPAGAAQRAPFDAQAFAAAQAAGQPVLVEVTAPWCPTCKAQKLVLAELEATPEHAQLAVFEVDFDSQKEALRALGAQQQSTLIVFKGETEVGRSVGDTDPASIAALLAKTL